MKTTLWVALAIVWCLTLNTSLAQAAFLPTDLTNLSVWLDANDATKIATSGSTVTGWTDKSGNLFAFTPAGAPQLASQAGLSGLNAVTFGGAESFAATDPGANSPLDFTSNATFFAVLRVATTAANHSVTSKMGGPSEANSYAHIWQISRSGHAGAQSLYSGSVWGDGTNSTVPTGASSPFVIVEMNLDGSRISDKVAFYVNGSAAGTNNSYSSLAQNDLRLWVGRQGGDGNFLNGAIAELVMYKSTLNDNGRNSVGGYLETKYGLTTAYVSPTQAPEPSTIVLLGMAGVLLLRTVHRLNERRFNNSDHSSSAILGGSAKINQKKRTVHEIYI